MIEPTVMRCDICNNTVGVHYGMPDNHDDPMFYCIKCADTIEQLHATATLDRVRYTLFHIEYTSYRPSNITNYHAQDAARCIDAHFTGYELSNMELSPGLINSSSLQGNFHEILQESS